MLFSLLTSSKYKRKKLRKIYTKESHGIWWKYFCNIRKLLLEILEVYKTLTIYFLLKIVFVFIKYQQFYYEPEPSRDIYVTIASIIE